MFSYLHSIYYYLFPKEEKNDVIEDEAKESFLAEQLLDLEMLSENNDVCNDAITTNTHIPRNADCFQRIGVITYINESNNYVLIDGTLYFETASCQLNFSISDKVLYLAYKDKNKTVIVVRILENHGIWWGDNECDTEEVNFKVIEHVMVGQVYYRKERLVYMKDNDIKFNLDDVKGTFVPIKGDWLELKCNVQWDDNKPSDISAAQVLQILCFKALRSKIRNAVITDWYEDYGTCDKQIFFNKQTLQNGPEPKVGLKVTVEAIESSQGICAWRAIRMIINDTNSDKSFDKVVPDEDLSVQLEREKQIQMPYPLSFKVNFKKTEKMEVKITNNSDELYILNKWIVLSKKRDSQINIQPFVGHPKKILPGHSFNLTITCTPKFLGNARECFIVMFKGFQLKRFIEISVIDESLHVTNNIDSFQSNNINHNNILNMRNIRKNRDNFFVPGVRPVKPPAFIPVKLGTFTIPDKVWSAILGDSNQTIHSSDYDKIVDRIESCLPCLTQDLNINNYIDKWHTLLYMEEIQANISMRAYDMNKIFLMHCQEYLGIEIVGLSERRPSLIKGDRVIVTDVWDNNAQKYEGYIHVIKGDLVLLKFNSQFHDSYSGSDVSIEFHFNRSNYRRAHQAINLALSHLGTDVLFPSRTILREVLISKDTLKNVKWYNTNLNSCQKAAVTNILLAECRPLPYCIYGPPGTGKTVTVIEVILQILSFFPDSRILVATPSNSASNLITERLLQYKDIHCNSIIRLIANHLLDSDNIPEIIKPFCGTLDIARENTAKCRYEKNKDGINLNCRSNFIGRHRVTIGTCICLGSLAQMELPRGHFTHIIVDEAGQATEPEIMIPMTFTDKENGQIILAGDPMQLGPVIMSKYCKEFGMDESYLSRILDTFPYQRDYVAYENGFNKKLVTKLNANYRSVKEVLTLPSKMFYDGSLIPQIDAKQLWIVKIIDVISDMFDNNNERCGGIFTYGIRGCNLRAEDSPSWYNLQEASMIALATCKLYKKNITVEEIGIITPYIAQIKHLRLLFEAMGLPQPKIGTVEEFQGQERPVILISTVRTSESHLKEDKKHTLGFVKNPKRLNVALTRAQVAVILFCDPHLLCQDLQWRTVITHSVNEDKYMGCDLPKKFHNDAML